MFARYCTMFLAACICPCLSFQVRKPRAPHAGLPEPRLTRSLCACVINNLPSLSVKIAMSEPISMSYFSHALTKYLTKKGGFILAHSFKAQSIVVRRSLAILHPQSGSRDERWCSVCGFSFLFSMRPRPMRWYHLLRGRGCHHRHTPKCVSQPSRLRVKMNHYIPLRSHQTFKLW